MLGGVLSLVEPVVIYLDCLGNIDPLVIVIEPYTLRTVFVESA